MIYIVIVSVLLGLVIGYSSPLVIPVAYSKIFSVALVAASLSATALASTCTTSPCLRSVSVCSRTSPCCAATSCATIAAADTSPCCAIPERRARSHRFVKIFLHYRNVADFMVKYTRKNTVY